MNISVNKWEYVYRARLHVIVGFAEG